MAWGDRDYAQHMGSLSRFVDPRRSRIIFYHLALDSNSRKTSNDLPDKGLVRLSPGLTGLFQVAACADRTLLESLEEIRRSWQRECYEFWKIQPKFCTSFAAGRRRALQLGTSGSLPLAASVVILPSRKKLKWWKSLFA
jgi:hypothetical protein